MTNTNTIYFIYDGECPICQHAAMALRIKEQFGTLKLINARKEPEHPLIIETTAKKLDLDQGMVIVANENFYHGQSALRFMAQFGERKNIFMLIFTGLFWSKTLTKWCYPWMRATRNWLIRRKGILPINNLQQQPEYLFEKILGKFWQELPPALKKHYMIKPYSQDTLQVVGELNVMCKPPLKWLSPILFWMGQIPVINQENVKVKVDFISDNHTLAFHFKRTFYFKNRQPYCFHSTMEPVKENELIEFMKYGLGWRLRYFWEDKKLILRHRGYVWRIFGCCIPIPFTFLLGKGYAEEIAIDDNRFAMFTHITHAWWGKIYEYRGEFEFKDAKS